MTAIPINVKKNPYYDGVKSLDGEKYRLDFRWNETTEKWYFGIKGLSNNVDIAPCIALLCGKDLLAEHGYLELGQLWVVDGSGANEDPTYDDFGSRWTLEYTPVGG
jgi:hypothetical protein